MKKIRQNQCFMIFSKSKSNFPEIADNCTNKPLSHMGEHTCALRRPSTTGSLTGVQTGENSITCHRC